MREDWENFRAAWLAEGDRLTQEVLGKKLGISKSYVSALGSGNKRFNEDLMEGFSRHTELPLSILFSKAAYSLQPRESEEMNKIREMIEAMCTVEDIKDILFGKFKELKRQFADELELKKKPKVICRVSES